ncbi:hypothetical protein CAPTEDRAFT_169602 [Capitella teleta]|uniref:Large ribosomal subunit protein uL11m n=1 Tax=Capitella teleta TaxID=283909 RepID=R7UNJ0_CAPTE|nr:hypothetical protein CAPTEDRAFT_169602 [Capitella teleta]|eukprot:ELU07658.1 hypothetical protein CAPTEDRAFT_169602 [Capitella teleta]
MASKGTKMVKAAKKGLSKVQHPPFLSAIIPAGRAMPAPPLGPQLGSRNIQIGQFCKDFNEKTKNVKEGTPLPTRINVNPDRSYNITFHSPPASWFLCKAAGIKKGAMKPSQEVAGKVTLKHIYEIAKIKSADPPFENVPMEIICKMIIGSAHSCGIEVVKELNAEQYGAFLEEREAIVTQQEEDLMEAKAAKMMRIS